MRSIRTRIPQLVVSACLALSLCLWTSAPAAAQGTGFEKEEGYLGAAEGFPLTDQLGWYLPAASSNHFVFTYKGNPLGLPPNPFGGKQFIGAEALGDMTFPRAQVDFDWSAATVWTMSYDLAVRYNGTLPAFDNISSFSQQDSVVARHFIAVNRWENLMTAENWRADYIVFNAAGQQSNPLSPGDAWRNLAIDHWYRQSTTIDFESNRVLSVALMDLDTGEVATFEPEDWYLAGGKAGGRPLPTALRFFVGGAAGERAGNVTGWDNLLLEPLAGPVPGRPASNRLLRPGRFPLATAK